MATLKEIIKDTHVGYGGSISCYANVVSGRELTDEDIAYAEKVIQEATVSQGSYDCFPDEGGINIAAYLLEEIKLMRETK